MACIFIVDGLTQIQNRATIQISKQEQSKVKDSRDEPSSNIQLPAIFPHKKLQYITTTKERQQVK